MNSADGEYYVELIAELHKDIKAMIQAKKYANALKISRSIDVETGKVDKAKEITFVDVALKDKKVRIYHPELWMKTFELAQKRYEQRFSSSALLTIRYRYVRGWEPLKTYVFQGISKRAYQTRRKDFLAMFLLYAVQNSLISIE